MQYLTVLALLPMAIAAPAVENLHRKPGHQEPPLSLPTYSIPYFPYPSETHSIEPLPISASVTASISATVSVQTSFSVPSHSISLPSIPLSGTSFSATTSLCLPTTVTVSKTTTTPITITVPSTVTVPTTVTRTSTMPAAVTSIPPINTGNCQALIPELFQTFIETVLDRLNNLKGVDPAVTATLELLIDNVIDELLKYCPTQAATIAPTLSASAAVVASLAIHH